eukprot:2284146-Rhodomonas_salina.2
MRRARVSRRVPCKARRVPCSRSLVMGSRCTTSTPSMKPDRRSEARSYRERGRSWVKCNLCVKYSACKFGRTRKLCGDVRACSFHGRRTT